MQMFQIAPASSSGLWILLPLLMIPVLIVVVVVFASISGMKAQFAVGPEGLKIKGDFYGRTIPAAELRGGSARRVDIGSTSDLRPVHRTWGTGLPGYRSGWFRLSNGQKALLYVTDSSKVVFVPTRGDFGVMVSPSDPDGFLSAIRSISPAP